MDQIKLVSISVVALVISLLATSCSKENSYSQKEMTENFKALVMGGKDIDPSQTWSTATSTPVTISVDLEAGQQYTVYTFLAHPATGSSNTYTSMTVLASGESKTIRVAKPNDVDQLYAACYDAQGHVTCMPVIDNEVSFSGNLSTAASYATHTTGNNWSVPVQSLPDLSRYTTGTLIDAAAIDTLDIPENDEMHFAISSAYNGFIPMLGTYTNKSVYVTSTWTLTYNQRVANGNTIVVGNGGKIIVPKDYMLSSSPLGEGSTGRIYVLPGGEISGEGALQLSNEIIGYHYNSGTITINEISLDGGTLYNAGTIGNSSSPATKLVGEASSSGTAGQLINNSSAYFSSTSGSALSIHNGGTISVSGNMLISSSARIDDGARIQCGTLTLRGGDAGATLYMGNAAYLACNGSISIDRYGVWGPSGNNYSKNAIFRVGGCMQSNVTSGNAATFMLDHVQLLMPVNASGMNLLNNWFNGGVQSDIEVSRKTCIQQLEGTLSSPKANCTFYAFEAPDDNSIRDYDYNDLVLRISTPYDNGDGTYTVSVSVAAIGSTQEIQVLYNGAELGKEVHEAMGIATNATINASNYSRSPDVLGQITLNDANTSLDKLGFTLRKKNSNGITQTLSQSTNTEDAPLYLIINGDTQGKWMWPKESLNIGLTYLLFSTWANNIQSATDWYHSENASSSRVVSW